MEFIPSKPLTVGVELELQLLDKESLNLINGIMPLIKLYPDSPYVKPEFIQNTVEIASKVCNNITQAHDHLTNIIRELEQNCHALGMDLCAAGSHPFARNYALITPLPRYLQLEKIAGYLGHTQITYATHVHIGVQSGEDAIYLMRSLKPYLPLLIAISASSPFWSGYDTGFVCYRHRILAASRSYGIPPSFEDWKKFSEFFIASQHAKILKTINDIHWDIRPRPHLGTIEIRVMDAQPTLTEVMEIAGFIRVLAAYLLQHKGSDTNQYLPHALPWWIEKDNHYTASRLGLDANYVFDKNGAYKPIIDILHNVIDELSSYANNISESLYINKLAARVTKRSVSYIRQHTVYKRTDSLKNVVSELIKELKKDIQNDKPQTL